MAASAAHTTLEIQVVAGKELRAMDRSGTSDPYLTLQISNTTKDQTTKCQTKVIKKNLNPDWNEQFELRVTDMNAVLTISVFDKDMIGADDLIGQTVIPLSTLVSRHHDRTPPVWLDIFDESEVTGHVLLAFYLPRPEGYTSPDERAAAAGTASRTAAAAAAAVKAAADAAAAEDEALCAVHQADQTMACEPVRIGPVLVGRDLAPLVNLRVVLSGQGRTHLNFAGFRTHGEEGAGSIIEVLANSHLQIDEFHLKVVQGLEGEGRGEKLSEDGGEGQARVLYAEEVASCMHQREKGGEDGHSSCTPSARRCKDTHLPSLMAPENRVQEVGKKGSGGEECEGSVKDVLVRWDHSGVVARYTVGGKGGAGEGGGEHWLEAVILGGDWQETGCGGDNPWLCSEVKIVMCLK